MTVVKAEVAVTVVIAVIDTLPLMQGSCQGVAVKVQMMKPDRKLNARNGGPQVVKIVLTMQEQLRKVKQVQFAM